MEEPELYGIIRHGGHVGSSQRARLTSLCAVEMRF